MQKVNFGVVGCWLFLVGSSLATACGSSSAGLSDSSGSAGSAGSSGSLSASGSPAVVAAAGVGGDNVSVGAEAGDSSTAGTGSEADGKCKTDADCQVGTAKPPGCAIAKCSTTTKACILVAVDADGDGHGTNTCTVVGDAVELGDDCDDSDPQTYPTAWDGPPNGKSPDRCDQVDNDCSGTPDDGKVGGKTCVCDPAKDVNVDCSLLPTGEAIEWPGGTPKGDCKYGKRSCVAGAWTQCKDAVVPASVDSCVTGSDANCNGSVNDNKACECAPGDSSTCAAVFKDKGVCGAATVVCDATGHFPKTCPVQPATEQCAANGLDEDCDGQVNEAPDCDCTNGETKTCGQVQGSLGDCAVRPMTCQNGKWSGQCAASSGELCSGDGHDEDCDGQVNEAPCVCTNGATQACGECGHGSQTCTNGTWAACNGDFKTTYYQDADGDGYCNKSIPIQACTQPGGYLSSACAADCKDSNSQATTECQKTVIGNSWIKPLTFGCANHDWNDICPAGFVPTNCQAVKTAGGAASAVVYGYGDNYCTLRGCDFVFDAVTAHPSVTCSAR